jgi:hypothetical protein
LTAAALVGLGVLTLFSLRGSLTSRTSPTRLSGPEKGAGRRSTPDHFVRATSIADEKSAVPPSGGPGSSIDASPPSSSSTPTKAPAWFDKPSRKSVEAGKLVSGDERFTVLLHKHLAESGDTKEWQRLELNAPVSSADQLMVLPGFRANLMLDKGVDVYLWGSVPFFLLPEPVLETAVTLNDNSAYDLDLTLLSGRVILSSRKEPASVRLRVYQEKQGQQIWDINLHNGAKVGLEKMAEPAPDFVSLSEKTAMPLTVFSLAALKGEAEVRVEPSRVLNLAGDARGSGGSLPGQIRWDSKSGRITTFALDPTVRKDWEKALPATKVAEEMAGSLQDLDERFKKTDTRTALREAIDDPRPARRILGVTCLGALDDLPGLLDVLRNYNDNQIERSVAAFVTLHSWLGRESHGDRTIYDCLLERKNSEGDAQATLKLLHGFSDERRRDPSTWEWLIRLLTHPNPMICYLAYHHLYQNVPEGREIGYSPRATAEQKNVAMAAWKKVIPDGSLPPGLR